MIHFQGAHISAPFHFCHQFALVKLSYALGMLIYLFFATESIWDIMVMIMGIDRRTFHLLIPSIFPREDPDNSSVQLVEAPSLQALYSSRGQL